MSASVADAPGYHATPPNKPSPTSTDRAHTETSKVPEEDPDDVGEVEVFDRRRESVKCLGEEGHAAAVSLILCERWLT